jgi:predicted dehydrogenase
VTGFCSIGKWHNIEVEDEVTAYLEYANGATGIFVTSTGEAPGSNRLEICGERGKVVLEDNMIKFTRNEIEMSKFCKTTKESFAAPATWDITIPASGNGGQHNEIIQNFIDAILHGASLLAPAVEGINSVELANAMLYSSMTKKPVDMPLDGAAHERLLKKLISESKFNKKTSSATSVDMSKSFGR